MDSAVYSVSTWHPFNHNMSSLYYTMHPPDVSHLAVKLTAEMRIGRRDAERADIRLKN